MVCNSLMILFYTFASEASFGNPEGERSLVGQVLRAAATNFLWASFTAILSSIESSIPAAAWCRCSIIRSLQDCQLELLATSLKAHESPLLCTWFKTNSSEELQISCETLCDCREEIDLVCHLYTSHFELLKRRRLGDREISVNNTQTPINNFHAYFNIGRTIKNLFFEEQGRCVNTICRR